METEEEKKRIIDELIRNFDLKFFRTLGEPGRLEILKFLIQYGRSDVGTISEAMPQDRSVVSRHLQLMHEAGILTSEKETRHVFYSVNGQHFIEKLEGITALTKQCISQCCPSCCK